MARVSVRMFATIREAAGTPSVQLVADDLEELLSKLSKMFGSRLSRLLDETVSDPERLVILVNGRNIVRMGSKPTCLSEGDEVAIFPPVSGG